MVFKQLFTFLKGVVPLRGTNALAYFTGASKTEKESFGNLDLRRPSSPTLRSVEEESSVWKIITQRYV